MDIFGCKYNNQKDMHLFCFNQFFNTENTLILLFIFRLLEIFQKCKKKKKNYFGLFIIIINGIYTWRNTTSVDSADHSNVSFLAPIFSHEFRISRLRPVMRDEWKELFFVFWGQLYVAFNAANVRVLAEVAGASIELCKGVVRFRGKLAVQLFRSRRRICLCSKPSSLRLLIRH